MQRKFTWIVIIVLLCAVIVGVRELRRMPDGRMHVFFFDVGQGDGALVVSPSGKQIVVDGGPNLSLLQQVGSAMPLWDRRIDLLILSHPHLDHLESFPELLRRYRIDAVLISGVHAPSSRYRELLELITEEKATVHIADPSTDIDMGDGLILDVVWPPPIYVGKEFEGDLNDTSVVVRMIYGADSVLFTGDAELHEEGEILSSGADIDADILKAGHHGSRTSSSTGFLLEVTPDFAIISAGRDNSYGHPHPEILRRFDLLDIPVHVTSQSGSLELIFDGKEGI